MRAPTFRVDPPPKAETSRFGIGRITGNLYLRVHGGAAWERTVTVVLIAPGPKNDPTFSIGEVRAQEDHQIDWLPEGAVIEVTL